MATVALHHQHALQEAVTLHQQGRLPEAENRYRVLLKKAPSFAEAYYYLAAVLMDQNKHRDAIPILQKGLARSPDNPQMLTTLSMAYQASGQIDRALIQARKVVKMHPKTGEAHYNLAQMLLGKGQSKEAQASFEKAVSLQPQLTNAWYNLGILHYNEQQPEEARTCFEKTLELDPSLVAAQINLAQLDSEAGAYVEAIAHLEIATREQPSHARAHKNLGMAYHVTGRIEDAEKEYLEAMRHAEPDAEMHILLGNVYRDQGNEFKSMEHYRKALTLEPGHRIAHENIQRIEGSKITGWHFRMLGDTKRNRAYHEAIQRAVDGKTVLDIGTGSGLLAMMAARAGAKSVTACEMIPPLAKVATEIVANNGLDDKVTVVQKKSTSIEVGNELPEKADVLVSEILDVGLLGEHVIPSHRHALANLMQPDAKVIPQSADVKGILVQCDDLQQVHPLKSIEGFDLSAFERFRTRNTYTDVALDIVPHEKLSEVFHVESVDFAQLPPTASLDAPNKTVLNIPITQSGSLQGIVFWFDLHVDDTITVSSGPDGDMIHWGQAMFFFPEPKEVEAGQEIALEVRQSDSEYRFALA